MAYFGNAIDCNLEELKGVKDSPKCNRDTWKRENDTLSDSSDKKP